MSSPLSPSKTMTSLWSSAASDIQLKRNRDKLRPYMLEAGILPDETRKDKLAVSHPHLQALATLWGLPHKDSDFFRKYVNERALCQFLAEYTAVVDSESTSPIRSPTKDKKKDVLGSPPPQATGIYKTVMRPYKSGDLFASRGQYTGAMLYLARLGPGSLSGLDGATVTDLGEGLVSVTATGTAPSSDINGASTGGLGVNPSPSTEEGGHDDSLRDVSLVEISLSSNADLKRKCTISLLRLSAKPSLQNAIVQAGAVDALCNMAGNSDAETRAGCVEALCNLISGLHSAPTLHPAALAAVSLACIENTTPHLQALCLGTFLKLICTQSQDSGIDFHTLVLENGIMVILKELCGRLPSLYDNVRQLMGSILVKLARRSRNHSSIIADGVVGLAVGLLDTNDAEAKAPIPLESSDEFGGLASKFGLPGTQGSKPQPRKLEDPGPGTDLEFDGREKVESLNVMDFLEGTCDQERGALVCLFLLATPEYLLQLLDVNVPAKIIALTRAKSLAQVTALKTLQALAQYPAGRSALVDNVVTGPLIAIVRASGKPEGKLLAVKILRELTADVACQPRLVEKGAVPALVSLSLLGEEYLERDIAIALCSLLLTESGSGAVAGGPGQKNILDMGALGALNSLARSDEEELQIRAANTLADLTVDTTVGLKLVEAGGINTLVELCKRDNGLIVQYTAVALGNLSAGNKRLQRRLVVDGVVGMVCRIAAKVDAVSYPMLMLMHLRPSNRQERCDMLTVDLRESIRKSCAAALGNLSYVKDMHVEFLKSGGLETLIQLANCPVASSITRISCATGLCNVSASPATRKRMVELGCVPVIVALGRSNPLETSKQDCARALCNLTCESGCEMSIVSQGAAGGLVMMALFRSDSAATKELCVAALFNLLCDNQSRVGLMREEVVWSFTRLVMSDFASDELRRIVSRMLCNMSSIPAARPVLIEQRAIQAVDVVVKAVGTSETASYIRRCCSIVLRNLSFDCIAPLKALREGLMETIQGLCVVTDPAALYQIGAAIGNFSCYPDCAEFVSKNEGVAVLLQLCNSEKPAVMRFVSIALANMCAQATVQKILVEERVVAALVMCSDTKNYGQVRLCAQAFYNLTCCVDSSVRLGVVESGVGRALSSLVNASLHPREDVAAIKASGKHKYPPPLPAERESTLCLIAAGICNLVQVEDCRPGLSESHVPPLLVRIAEQTRRADVMVFTLNSIAALSCRRVDLPRFVNAGAIPIIVDVGKMGVEGAPLDVVQRRRPVLTGASNPMSATLTLRRLVLRCLHNLAHDVESRIRQVNDGILEVGLALGGFTSVVAAAKKAEKAAMAREAAASGATSKVPSTASSVAKAASNPKLTAPTARSGMTKSSASSVKGGVTKPGAKTSQKLDEPEGVEEEEEGELSESDPESPDDTGAANTLSEAVEDELAETTARLIWNISRPGANAINASMLREGAVAALLKLCTNPSPLIENIATVALKNLSEDKPRRKRLGELGVVPVLTAVIKSTKNPHTKDAATMALRNIAAEGGGEATDALVADAGVDMLVRLMMAGGGDAAAEGMAAAVHDRAPRQDDPQTNTQQASKMLPPSEDMRAGIPDGIGYEEGFSLTGSNAKITKPKWLSVYNTPVTVQNEPFVAGFTVELDEAPPAKATTESSSDDDDDDSHAGKGHELDNMPGDYPGPDDLDVLASSKMWTKVGGGALAETGLAPARLIREEERAKGAVHVGGQDGDQVASAPTNSGSALSLDSSLVAGNSMLDSLSSPLPGSKVSSPGAALRVGSPSAPLKPVTRTPSQRKLGEPEVRSPSSGTAAVAPGVRPNPRASSTKLTPISRQ